MNTPVLARIPFLKQFVDERFLEHRRRAAANAGILGGVLAILLWYYEFIFQHRWDWPLMTVALVIVSTKMALFAWYRLRD